MARVMSLVFMTFMLVPVLAPNIGQVDPALSRRGARSSSCSPSTPLVMLTWSWIRLPETLHPEYRRSLAWREIGERDARDHRASRSRAATRWP